MNPQAQRRDVARLRSEGMQQPTYRELYGAHRALIERAVRRLQGEVAPDSTWSVCGWLRSLSLHDAVAEALQEPLGDDPFEYVLGLSSEDLRSKLVAARLDGLAELLERAVSELRAQRASTGAVTGAELSAKFADEANFQMAFGSLSTFFGGLEALVDGRVQPTTPTHNTNPPHMYSYSCACEK